MDVYDELKLLTGNSNELEAFAMTLASDQDKAQLLNLVARMRVNIETVKAAAEEYEDDLDDEYDDDLDGDDLDDEYDDEYDDDEDDDEYDED